VLFAVRVDVFELQAFGCTAAGRRALAAIDGLGLGPVGVVVGLAPAPFAFTVSLVVRAARREDGRPSLGYAARLSRCR
jgi:hypothetical protein